MKKKTALILALCFAISPIQAIAYEFPHAFWAMNSGYEAALSRGDHSGVIEYGTQIINLMSGEQECAEKRNTLIPRYNQVANSYAALGEYDSSARVFTNLYNYAIAFGDEYYDYTKGAKAKAEQYQSAITMYTDRGTPTYYGAVNEKKNGVLFGICANGATRSQLPNESMVLIYQELGQALLPINVDMFEKAAASGHAVELALNCPNEAGDIKNISAMSSYLGELSALFAKYPSTPVYLRFGAEFNTWTYMAEPEEFKAAFRQVSTYFKSRNKNVALVWSPNQVSGWYVDMNDFYPGDEYVDWVGVSLYAQPYFLGDKTQSADSNLFFKTGINSNPVIAMKEIVEKYGSRKPIMLAESGAGHKVVHTGEDTTQFALQRLKEQYYYLPMVYPQIKLMAYFDWHVNADNEKHDFRLSTNPQLQNEYLKLVKGSRFIQNGYNNDTEYCYRPVYNGTNLESVFELSCYAHMYNANITSVTYFIDGEYAAMSNAMPYTSYIDAKEYAGQHMLKAVAAFDNGKTLIAESTVFINNPGGKVNVEINSTPVSFDQEPVIYNDRTMVPMRKIFEELGAQVSWDDASKTATGIKDGKTIKITLGQTTMYINNEPVMLDTAPIILASRTLVPARAVAEGLGCKVNWDGTTRTVQITPA